MAKFNSKDLLKIEAELEAVIEQVEIRERHFGKQFAMEVKIKLEMGRHALRSIANIIN